MAAWSNGQYIADEIVVFRVAGQVVVAAAFDTDEGDHFGVDLLQGDGMLDGDQPVARAMDDISMAFHILHPSVRFQLVAKHEAEGEDGQELLDGAGEIIVWRIQDEVARGVLGGEFGGEAAAQASAIDDDLGFRIIFLQGIIHVLHITQHGIFAALAGAFPKPPVVYQHHIIIIPVEIPGIFGPALDAAGVAMEIEDHPMRIIAVEMEAVDADARLYVKEQFAKGDIIHVLEILGELFRFEDEFLLYQVADHHEGEVNGANEVPVDG